MATLKPPQHNEALLVAFTGFVVASFSIVGFSQGGVGGALIALLGWVLAMMVMVLCSER